MSQVESQDFYQKIEKAIQTREFPNLLLFFGEESYLIHQAVRYVKACVLEGGSVDFNWRSFECGEADATAIKDEIETLPMMASHRVVLVKECSEFRDADWQTLMPVIENPVPSTVVMMTAAKLDKRKKAVQAMINASLSVEFKKPYDNQIPGWIRHIAKGLGLEIESQALEIFHRKVGSSLLEIEGELRKMRSYLGKRTEILVEDVEASVSDRREENIFSLAGVMAVGDKSGSLIQAAKLLEQGESELGIVALTARHFRILANVHMGLEQGLSGAKLASHAQVPPYFLNDYQRQVRAWSLARIEKVMVVLSETEKALKSSPLSGGIWIDNMIAKITALQTKDDVVVQGTL
jgi:DNA polymerase-3 subunit delta